MQQPERNHDSPKRQGHQKQGLCGMRRIEKHNKLEYHSTRDFAKHVLVRKQNYPCICSCRKCRDIQKS